MWKRRKNKTNKEEEKKKFHKVSKLLGLSARIWPLNQRQQEKLDLGREKTKQIKMPLNNSSKPPHNLAKIVGLLKKRQLELLKRTHSQIWKLMMMRKKKQKNKNGILEKQWLKKLNKKKKKRNKNSPGLRKK